MTKTKRLTEASDQSGTPNGVTSTVGLPISYCPHRLGVKNIRIANHLGAMRIQRYRYRASFPTTVLTVSGSRVRATKPNLSRLHPAPRR